MLNCVESYSKEYRGVYRFGYTHIKTAHEKSGTIFRTVKNNLLKFFKDTMDLNDGIDEKEFLFCRRLWQARQ